MKRRSITPSDRLRLLLGVVCILASVLKLVSLISNIDRSYDGLRLPASMVYLAVFSELALGIWLLALPMSIVTWSAAVFAFSVYACIAFYQWISGVDACKCFGALSIPPFYTFIFDCTALTALITCRTSASGSVDSKSLPEKSPVMRAQLMFVIATIISALTLASGIIANSRLPRQKWETPIAYGSQVNLSPVGPNLNILLSPVIVPSTYLRAPITDNSVTDFFLKLGNVLGLELEPHQLSLSTVLCQESGELAEPYLLITTSRRALVLIGRYDEAGTAFYEVLDGFAPPSLIPKSSLQDIVAEVWQIVASMPDSPKQAAQLTADRQYHSFGAMSLGEPLETAFLLTNRASTTLVIENVSTSCGCVQTTLPTHLSLNPGEEVSLPVTVRQSVGSFRQVVTIHVTDPLNKAHKDIELGIFGSQLPVGRVSPESVNFGSVAGNSPIRRQIQIHETPADQFAITNITKADGSATTIQWEIMSTRISGEHSCKIYDVELTLDPEGLDQHDCTGVLRVLTTSKRQSFMDVRYTSTDSPFVRFVPKTISFGTAQLGQVVERCTSLKVAAVDATIAIPASEDNQNDNLPFSIAKIERGRDGEFIISVSFRPAAPGPFSRSLPVTLTKGGKTQTLVIGCTGLVNEN